MKKIGREVLFIKADKTALRNGEGAFIRLKSGAIMLLYTEYCGDDWHDHCDAQLTACFSYDEGESWKDKKVIVKKDEGTENIMSASLLRMNNGDIGLFYLQKFKIGEIVYDKVLMKRSSDEGETWSEAVECSARASYYVVNNDRVIRLKSGRIIIPAAEHKRILEEPERLVPGTVSCFYSDDDGNTWNESDVIYPPFDNTRFGLMEPGLFEKENGELYMYIRTELGFQFECTSKDGGKSWGGIKPNLYFASPDSPMLIKNVGGKTVAIFNPVPNPAPCMKNENVLFEKANRTPYICAVSDDGGETYDRAFYIEDDLENNYCYPAILDGDGYFLVCYYHSNGTNSPLNSLKVIKITHKEVENPLR